MPAVYPASIMVLPTTSKSMASMPSGTICHAARLPHNSITKPSLIVSPYIGGRDGFFDFGGPLGGPEGGPVGGLVGGPEGGPEGGPVGGLVGGPEGGPEGGPDGGPEGGAEGGPLGGPDGGLVGGLLDGCDGGSVGGEERGALGGRLGGVSATIGAWFATLSTVVGGVGAGVTGGSVTVSAGAWLTCFENASKSVESVVGSFGVGAAVGVVTGAESSGSPDFCHGGTLGASSVFDSSIGALPTVIAVAPPAEFSPKYEVILILDASINPRSSTWPKSPRSLVNASVNMPLPIELLYTLPFSAWKVKSWSNGPKSASTLGDRSINVQLPFCNGNSKVNFRVKPGPSELIPCSDVTFFLLLV